MDGGSVERWEDPRYRDVYGEILEGRWEEFDAWQMGESDDRDQPDFGKFADQVEHRVEANQNMYDGAGAVSSKYYHLV